MASPTPTLNIVLHQPEIPGNTGAVGRTCVAVGAKLWLVRPLGFRIDEKSLKRAGLDYWQHLDWEVADSWNHLVEQTAMPRTWYFSRFAARDYTEVDFQTGDMLVFGAETTGLPKKILEANPERCLRIPTTNLVRSLNLATSVGVAAFEAFRQIRTTVKETDNEN